MAKHFAEFACLGGQSEHGIWLHDPRHSIGEVPWREPTSWSLRA